MTPTKTAALTHLRALCNANMPTSVLMHSAAEAMAELFARVWGEPVQIRIGKTIIAREPKT